MGYSPPSEAGSKEYPAIVRSKNGNRPYSFLEIEHYHRRAEKSSLFSYFYAALPAHDTMERLFFIDKTWILFYYQFYFLN
jgi:hypothetical protein